MFADYEVVKLRQDMPSKKLKAGARGTILMAYPETPQAYEVEFLDSEGDTIAVLTVQENELVAVTSEELAA